MLAAPGGLGGVERGENGLRSVQPGDEVSDRGADLVGRAVGRAALRRVERLYGPPELPGTGLILDAKGRVS